MFPTTYKQTLATAIAGAALAGAVGAANAPAMPGDPLHDGYGDAAAIEPVPVETTAPSTGFDVSSAVLGALGTGMIAVALAAGGFAWRRNPTGPQGAARA